MNSRKRTHPNLLLVAGTGWHAQVDTTIAASKRAVLGLAVHARGRTTDAEELSDTIVERELRMCLLYALEQVQRVLRECGDGEANGCRRVAGGEWELPRTLTAGSDKEATTRAVGVCRVGREIGAAYNAELDVRVLYERETDSVLLAAEEALGAVDGVECPETCSRLVGACYKQYCDARPVLPPPWFPRSMMSIICSGVCA